MTENVKTNKPEKKEISRRSFIKTAGDLFFLRFVCLNVFSHKLPPLLSKND